MQVVDDRLLIGLPALGAASEHFPQTLPRLARSPRSASMATRALNAAVNRRRFVAISFLSVNSQVVEKA
ncbi:MAG: hypothetical protein OXQ31_16750 [Spirochaetaceae bacterium]|nr:hypothetical protein [Spirochaetaceae bacterium]